MQVDIQQKVVIGTTKFGMPYGAIDQTQVDEFGVERIFSKAHQLGFNCFDTAPSYGDAERLIGRYLAPELRSSCITKVAKISSTRIQAQDLRAVDECFRLSLKNMQTHSCYGLLVHDVQDLNKSGAEKLLAWMQSLKQRGLVNKIGVSVYTPKEAEELCQRFDFDLIQLPCNIFDQRFLLSGAIDRLAEAGIEVHARSLFLKGLLLKAHSCADISESKMPRKLLKHAESFFESMRQINISTYDSCLSFAKSQKAINRWVIGLSSEQQLARLLESDCNKQGLIDFGRWAFFEDAALDPRTW